jgi:7-keto-8-aminopelargonate synthetase-like enzyme
MASVPKVRKFRHNDAEHLAHVLGRHRLCNAENAILVVTEGLFSMDSDSPDISKTQAICRNYDATLVVDVAHDFGCLGPGGTGMIGAQGMLGKVDLVMGSFSKTFATNGGFVATNSRAVSEYLRFYSSPTTFSNALSPSQAAVVLEALRIIDSPEGEDRRRRLMNAIMKLRTELLNHGISANGIPSPIVPIISGREDLSRIAARNLLGAGCLANLVEFPAVKKGAARFRFQVQSDHTDEDASQAARSLAEALAAAKASLSVSMVEEARGRVVEFSVPDEDFTLSKPVLPTWADSYTAGCKILG